MLESINPAILSAVVSFSTALIVLLVSKYFDAKKQRNDFTHAYKAAYFEKQLTAYQELWTLYRPLSRNYDDATIFNYSTTGSVKVNDRVLHDFCSAVSQFFFSSHGIFISRNTRKYLFSIRENLMLYAADKQDANGLRKRVHTLSTELFQNTRKDIGLTDLGWNVDKHLAANSRIEENV